MEFAINRNRLLDGLNIVSKAVTTKGTMEILSCILFEVLEDGIRLSATDLELGIKTSVIPAEVKKTGSVLIEGKLLMDIVKKLAGEDVNIRAEKSIVFIECGKSAFKLNTQEADDFPQIKEVEKDKSISLSQGELKQAIKQTIFASSVDESKPVFTGELFEIADGLLHIVAVDGFRIAYRTNAAETDQPDASMVIPSKTLSEIHKLLSPDEEKNVSLYYTKNHALFELETCTLVTRLIEGEFLKYQQMFETSSNLRVDVNTQDMLTGVDRASLLSIGSSKKPITLKITEKSISISSVSEIGSSFEEIQTISYEGEPGLEINFNPRYLMDILSVVDSEIVALCFTTDMQPLIVKPVIQGGNFNYLLLPLRKPGK